MLVEKYVVEVMADRNQIKLQLDRIQLSEDHALVPAIVLEDAEGAFGLDRTVHLQHCTMNALEVFQNLLLYIVVNSWF